MRCILKTIKQPYELSCIIAKITAPAVKKAFSLLISYTPEYLLESASYTHSKG